MSINRTEYGNPLGFSTNQKPIILESDEHLPHTCPQCESVDPSEQCDSCEGCENCLEFCSHCENPTCIDCCAGHD